MKDIALTTKDKTILHWIQGRGKTYLTEAMEAFPNYEPDEVIRAFKKLQKMGAIEVSE